MSSDAPSHPEDEPVARDPLDEAFDEFCGAWIDGQRPDVATFVLPFGARSEELRRRLDEFVEVMLTVRTVSTGEGQNSMPKRIGEYVIERELGRGGMGVVYHAQQESLGRAVALKVLDLSFSNRDGLRDRFQHEAEAAARLRHPGIVSIHAVGEEGSTPFIAMELVDGAALHRILDRLAASETAPEFGECLFDALTAELEIDHGVDGQEAPSLRPGGTYIESVCRILIQVADALSYAHRQGVIHRDVKPSNILLRRDGTVVLADFGIARLEGRAPLTRTGEQPGTPQYMAPERGLAASSVDPRVDVYSLGVVLFEMLTLRRPFEGSHSAEVWHAVLHKEPPLAKREFAWIPRDLATICSTAMEKDLGRRYQGATEFANDLRRFLAFRPISARSMHPLKKGALWARRHPLQSLVWGAALACLTVAPAVIAWREHQSSRRVEEALVQKNAALEQAATELEGAQQITGLLVDLFRLPEPNEALGRAVTVADLLGAGVESSRRRLADRPDLRGVLLKVLGTVHASLGLFDDAQDLLEESVADHQAAFGAAHRQTREAELELASVLAMGGHLPEAKRTLEKLLGDSTASEVEGAKARLRALSELASVQRKLGLFDEAMTSIDLAWSGQQRLLGLHHGDTRASQRERSQLLIDRGEYEEAESALRRLAELSMESLDPIGVDDLWSRMTLAHLLERQGSDEEAEEMLRETLVELKQLLGAAHPSTLIAENNLAQLQQRTGDLAAAEKGFVRVLAGFRKGVGENHPLSLTTEYNLGCLYVHQVRFAEASPLLERSLHQRRETLGDEHPDTLSSRFAWARILIWRDLEDEGEREMREVIELRNSVLGVRHFKTLRAKDTFASFLNYRGKSMAAEEMWRETRAIAKESLGLEHHVTRSVTVNLAKFLASDGRAAEAQAMIDEVKQMVAPSESTPGPAAPIVEDAGKG